MSTDDTTTQDTSTPAVTPATSATTPIVSPTTPTQTPTLDPAVVNLAKAIRKQESGGNYTLPGASGEYGAYQFTNDTWNGEAPKYGINVPLKEATPEQQNAVAYNQIKAWKDAGKDVTQIASMWNAGEGEPDAYTGKFSTGKPSIGTNNFGFKYDVPSYVKAVTNNYLQFKNSTTASSPDTDLGTGNTDTQTDTQAQPSDLVTKIGNVASVATGALGMNPLLKGIGQTIANATGSTDAVDKANTDSSTIQGNLIQKIQQDKAQGKDTSKLEDALKSITQHISSEGEQMNDLGTQGITTRDVVGSAISTAATFAPGASEGASLLTKIISGALAGYGIDVGTNLQNKDKTIGQAFTPGFGTVIGATLPFAGSLISSLAKKAVGFTTGTGEEVIQRALDNPDAVGDAVKTYAKNPAAKQDLVDTAISSIRNFVKQKGTEFANTLDSLAVKEGGNISKQPVIDALKSSLDDFGVTISNDGLDFTNSQLSKEAESTLNQVFDKVNNWTDETPSGLDSLRQYIKGEMGNYKVQGSSKVDAILNDAMKAVRKNLTDNVPGYSDMLSTYAQKSSTAGDLLKELQLSGTAKNSTKLNNILKIFKKDPTILDNLYKVMGKKDSEDFLNQVSGAILSDWLPAGKVGSASRTAAEVGLGLGAHALGIGAAPAVGAVGLGMAVTSPRIVGAGARVLGSRVAQVGGKVIQRALTGEAAKINP